MDWSIYDVFVSRPDSHMSLTEQTAQTIAQYQMLKPEQKVLVALSGGADSVALLLVLRELGYPVYAYHLNHCLRGAESEHDAEFVHSLCRKLQIACTIGNGKQYKVMRSRWEKALRPPQEGCAMNA